MKTLPLSEVKMKLSALVDRVEATRRGGRHYEERSARCDTSEYRRVWELEGDDCGEVSGGTRR